LWFIDEYKIGVDEIMVSPQLRLVFLKIDDFKRTILTNIIPLSHPDYFLFVDGYPQSADLMFYIINQWLILGRKRKD
jgi:hypothetical protein